MHKSGYQLGEEWFPKKKAITERCRGILNKNSLITDPVDTEFLLALFSHHHEWFSEKRGTGVVHIYTKMTEHGTKAFFLHRSDNTSIDISYVQAVSDLKNKRRKMPHELKSFKMAARYAIRGQIESFRESFVEGITCPVTGELITRENLHIDHAAPATFDFLLFEFCVRHSLNPIYEVVESKNGVIPIFADTTLNEAWWAYHQIKAKLRFTTKAGNLQSQQARIDWEPVLALPSRHDREPTPEDTSIRNL